MANRKFVVKIVKKLIGLIIICPIFVFPQIILAYDTLTTHRAVTNESAKVFNHYYPDQSLSTEQINLLIKGSADEDTPPRWLNHFYDPVYNRGFRGLLSSKNWAENTSAQALLINKTPLAEYFSSPTDYSWERAIYDYVYGDKNRAIEALGHNLHLIQDATVPDHTRDDAHPIWSTYENYAKRFELNNSNLSQILITKNLRPLILGNLGEYFDYLASFSNNNFFSDDTIFYRDYSKPIKEYEKDEISKNGLNYKFGFGSLDQHLVRIKKDIDIKNNKIYNSYFLGDSDNKIMTDYWFNLSDKATLASAGVIKLFFEEAEKEKQVKRLFEKNKSLVQKFWDNLNGKISNLLASVSLSGQNSSQTTTSSTTLATTTEEAKVIIPDEEPAIIADLIQQLEQLRIKINELQQAKDESAGNLVASTIQVISSGNSPLIVKNLIIPDEQGVPSISSPVITSPNDFSRSFATDTIVFTGSSSPNLIIFNDFNRDLVTSSETGDWQITLTDLPQGASMIKFYARDSENNVSSPTVINLNIDSLPLALNLTINECQKSLLTDPCYLISTSTLNLAWSPTKVGDYNYDLVKTSYVMGEWSSEVTSLTETLISVLTSLEPDSFNKEIKWQVLAREANSGEVVASSSLISTIFHPRPIVINEIGWAGTTASTTDEWIELRSFVNNYAVDLNNYYLTDIDNTWRVDLSSSIVPQDYYLIERGSDDGISNRSANLVASWGSDPLTKGFNSNRIGVKLWRTIEGEEELIDQTPVWDKSSAEPSSLERNWENKISTDLSSWEENNGCNEPDGPCALDRNGNETFGTPGVINLASTPRLL